MMIDLSTTALTAQPLTSCNPDLNRDLTCAGSPPKTNQ